MFLLVLMAQLNSEKLSQGFPSLQNFRSWTKVHQALVVQISPLNLIDTLPAMTDSRLPFAGSGTAQTNFLAVWRSLAHLAWVAGLSTTQVKLIDEEFAHKVDSNNPAGQAIRLRI